MTSSARSCCCSQFVPTSCVFHHPVIKEGDEAVVECDCAFKMAEAVFTVLLKCVDFVPFLICSPKFFLVVVKLKSSAAIWKNLGEEHMHEIDVRVRDLLVTEMIDTHCERCRI